MHENLDKAEEVKVSSGRSFGIAFLILFLAVGMWMVSRNHSEGWLFLAGSMILFVVGSARPPPLPGPLNRAWFKFGLPRSPVVNPLTLGVVFFMVTTLMAVVRRLLGKDLLHLKSKPDLESYWVDRSPAGPKLGSMTK